METIKSVRAMQDFSANAREMGRTISLVPTMGFLHDGHMSLIRKARTMSDVLVVSIFVNPTQFGPGEDLTTYPRDIERDTQLCEEAGVDIIFCPDASEMYSPDNTVYVEESSLSCQLCGKSRPGHFRGVLTVVLKLFNIVRPQISLFGQKDAQQVRVIQQMVDNLNVPVDVVVGPIVREPDGLAMSSRNAYLSAKEREQSVSLSHALARAAELYESGQKDASLIADDIRCVIEQCDNTELDYVEIVDYKTLAPVDTIDPNTLVALAVQIGKTRLIDNLLIKDLP